MAVLEPVGFHKALYHGPILASLCLFSLNKIGQGHEVQLDPFNGDGGPPFPEIRKRVHPSHFGHHINPKAFHTFCLAPKMNRKPLLEIPSFEGWNRDNFSL
jgi:hypothetical protein